MRHLVIKALHREESFLSQGIDKLIHYLKEQGDDVDIRDLYQENFQPVLSVADFQALKQHNLPDDIKKEQEFVKKADRIWIVFPIWWTSMPAILKGYIDRVFLSGFAYTMNNDTPVGLLRGKKVIIVNSMGMSEEDYEQSGMFEALKLTIDKGIFEFVGMEVIAHKYFTSIMSAEDELRESYFQELIKIGELSRANSEKALGKSRNKNVA